MARPGVFSISDDVWTRIIALAALPIVAHLMFSTLGFNPTDDGFIMAMSRRLLDGEIAHRDFISIRPVGSAFLHAPWVLIGGEATYWIARLAVWFEFALISWCWARLAHHFAGRPARPIGMLLVTWVAFVLTSHTFPIMPWHTIDGITLASVGLLLAVSPSPPKKIAGYLLLGAAGLCKQNFIPLAPLAALMLGDRRIWYVGFAAVAPFAVYGVYLVGNGALISALSQMSTQAGLQQTGLMVYLHNPYLFAGIGLGALVSALQHPGRTWRMAPREAYASVLVGALLLTAGFMIDRPYIAFMNRASFLLFGAVLGATAMLAFTRGWRDGSVRLGGLALLTGWCASISIGLNSPALASGALAACLLVRPRAAADPIATPVPALVRHRIVLGAALACALAMVWGTARYQHIYRDRPTAELTRTLDGVWPGAGFLRTNENTYALLADLRRAKTQARGRPYALIADFPGYWVSSHERNPLSIDWPQSTELHRASLKQRLFDDIEALRGNGCLIVQKVAAGPVAEGFLPIEDQNYYFLTSYVRDNFRRRGETAWFDIYE